MKLKDVTVAQRHQIADTAGIDREVLRHLQAGRRPIGPAVAARIEKAAKRVKLDIRRESMCEACKGCDLAKKARKCE